MRNTNSITGHGSPSAPDHPDQDLGHMVLDLEALPCGRRFSARDGCRFIRTNLICFGFCELASGHLCSARDICTKHGGANAKAAPAVGLARKVMLKT